jgi:alcohol dehydrogenase
MTVSHPASPTGGPELVAIQHADLNLVRIPDGLNPVHAAVLGCRFATAYRAVVDRGRMMPGEWLVVHGCGGVGLSAVMIAASLGVRVVAVDIDTRSLAMAADLGAEALIDASDGDPVGAIRDTTGGGAHGSIDAVGTRETALNSIRSLRKHGRHVQVGLLLGADSAPPIPMELVIMGELEILGSRGMPATDYPSLLDLIASGAVNPGRLVTRTVSLEAASSVLQNMGSFTGAGMCVIDRF